MGAEADPERLLASMSPALDERPYVFVTVPPNDTVPGGVDVIASVREPEGLSIVLSAADAERAGLAGEFRCAWITLRVHSALDAVGFLAAVTRALADEGISANAVAGFHHDHVFVPWTRRHDAVRALRALTRR